MFDSSKFFINCDIRFSLFPFKNTDGKEELRQRLQHCFNATNCHLHFRRNLQDWELESASMLITKFGQYSVNKGQI